MTLARDPAAEPLYDVLEPGEPVSTGDWQPWILAAIAGFGSVAGWIANQALGSLKGATARLGDIQRTLDRQLVVTEHHDRMIAGIREDIHGLRGEVRQELESRDREVAAALREVRSDVTDINHRIDNLAQGPSMPMARPSRLQWEATCMKPPDGPVG